jgi:putative transposase
MTEHLGFEPNEVEGRGSGNSRNGHTPKTVQTETGPVPIRVPRDRRGTFEPKLVPKHRRRLEGFDDKVLALYARGMSTRDIQEHLRELYGTCSTQSPIVDRARWTPSRSKHSWIRYGGW